MLFPWTICHICIFWHFVLDICCQQLVDICQLKVVWLSWWVNVNFVRYLWYILNNRGMYVNWIYICICISFWAIFPATQTKKLKVPRDSWQPLKYKNTNTQIHKYSIRRSARKTQHVVYFWKEDCSRIWKIIFPSVKRTSTKYTNTQIQILLFQDIYIYIYKYGIYGIRCCWLIAPLTNFIIWQCKQCL